MYIQTVSIEPIEGPIERLRAIQLNPWKKVYSISKKTHIKAVQFHAIFVWSHLTAGLATLLAAPLGGVLLREVCFGLSPDLTSRHQLPGTQLRHGCGGVKGRFKGGDLSKGLNTPSQKSSDFKPKFSIPIGSKFVPGHTISMAEEPVTHFHSIPVHKTKIETTCIRKKMDFFTLVKLYFFLLKNCDHIGA